MIFDDKVVKDVWNTDPKSFKNVKVYQGSPTTYTNGLFNPSEPDVSFENFIYEQLEEFPTFQDPSWAPGINTLTERVFKNNEIKIIPYLSPFYTISMKFKVKENTSDRSTLLLFTSSEKWGECEAPDSNSIVGEIIHETSSNQIFMWMNNKNNKVTKNISPHTWHTIEISQEKENDYVSLLEITLNLNFFSVLGSI